MLAGLLFRFPSWLNLLPFQPVETNCSHNKTIWIFLPRGLLKVCALEGIKRVQLMKEWVIPANDVMVCNGFNTWQIMQMALKITSFLASPCPVQLNKTCIEISQFFFFWYTHMFWISAMAQFSALTQKE